jgi:ribonucleoside-diphosphate reductase alpha chain
MDDIIDLEIEKIEAIMEKIESDPGSEEVKGAERKLWQKIMDKSTLGRRTGVGITAEGDMLAAMGLRYGTDEATDFSEKVHRTIAIRTPIHFAMDGCIVLMPARRSYRRQW